MGENANEVVTLTRAELDELVARAAKTAVEAEEERRREESVAYRGHMSAPEFKLPNPKLGQEIKERREELGLTIGDLSNMTKISGANIEEYENGLFYHTPHIVKIKKALGMEQ